MSFLKFGFMLALYARFQHAPPPSTEYDTMRLPPVREAGLASWYGDGELHGDITANGEPFEPEAATCAHRSLPFDTVVLLVNPVNAKRAWCRVNDRGPYGRLDADGVWGVEVFSEHEVAYRGVLDMSIATADRLDTRRQGLQQIELRYWSPARHARPIDLRRWML